MLNHTGLHITHTTGTKQQHVIGGKSNRKVPDLDLDGCGLVWEELNLHLQDLLHV